MVDHQPEDPQQEPSGEDPDGSVDVATPNEERVSTETQSQAFDSTSEHIAGHENSDIAIVRKPDQEDYQYQYFFVDSDGHEFPIWPDEIEQYRELLDELEKKTRGPADDSVPPLETEFADEDASDPLVNALPDRLLPLGEIHEVVSTTDMATRGTRKLNCVEESSEYPTIFYLLAPPGFRLYGFNESAQSWEIIATITIPEGYRGVERLWAVTDAAEEWYSDTYNQPCEARNGHTQS